MNHNRVISWIIIFCNSDSYSDVQNTFDLMSWEEKIFQYHIVIFRKKMIFFLKIGFSQIRSLQSKDKDAQQ